MAGPDRFLRRYRVAHDYRCGRWHFTEGAEVELLSDDARWLNRDSPGLLEPVAPTTTGSPEED